MKTPSKGVVLAVLLALGVGATANAGANDATNTDANAAASTASSQVNRTLRDTRIIVTRPAKPRMIDAAATYLLDARDGRVLYSRSSRSKRNIASTTKIMTALVVLSRARMTQMYKRSNYNPAPVESTVGLRPGERMSVRDLLHALLLASANDAADTLAVNLANSRAAFVRAMNRRARRLGMTDTHFGNSIGLDMPRNISSARDLALLSRAAMNDPRFRRIVRKTSARLVSGERPRRVKNRNTLLGTEPWIDGIKTGRTQLAGFVLAGAAHVGPQVLISTVLGAPSESARNRSTLALLRFGRKHYRQVKVADKNRSAVQIDVSLQDYAARLYPARNAFTFARNRDRLRTVARVPSQIKGPFPAGRRLGTLDVYRAGEHVARVALVLRRPVAVASARQQLSQVTGVALRLVLGALAAVMIVFAVSRRRGARKLVAETASGSGAKARTEHGGDFTRLDNHGHT